MSVMQKSSYTVSYEPTGRYYLSLQVETEVNQLPEMHQSVGLDMGLADLAISSLMVSSTALLTQNGWKNKPLGGNVSMPDVVTLLNTRCGSGIITALTIWKSLMIIQTGSVQESIKPAASNGLPISAEITFIS